MTIYQTKLTFALGTLFIFILGLRHDPEHLLRLMREYLIR